MAAERTSSYPMEAGFVHEALMYRDESEFDAAMREFLLAAAAAGEPVLVALPGARLERVRRRLANEVPEVRFEDAERLGRNPSRLLPVIEEWVRSHDGPVRVVSEVVWPGRSYAETVEALRHEALLNHALADSAVTVLSPFDAEHLDEATLAGAEMTHPTVLEGGQRRTSASYRDPLAMPFGELWPLQSPTGHVSEHSLEGTLLELRHAVAGDPALEALSVQRRSDLVFAVSEAAGNAVKHGDGTCTTRIWHDGDEVITEVSTPTGISDVMAGCRRPAADALEGRGLWLINQLCDLVELRSDGSGTTLRMHVREH
jgi:anti-sigma regulatory factor (Ser/Thr protein kinase)